MTAVRERYRPHLMTAGSTYRVTGSNLGGFIPTVDGSLTVFSLDNQGNTITLIDAVPVFAGSYLPLPIASPYNQPMTVALTGAAGTLLV